MKLGIVYENKERENLEQAGRIIYLMSCALDCLAETDEGTGNDEDKAKLCFKTSEAIECILDDFRGIEELE